MASSDSTAQATPTGKGRKRKAVAQNVEGEPEQPRVSYQAFVGYQQVLPPASPMTLVHHPGPPAFGYPPVVVPLPPPPPFSHDPHRAPSPPPSSLEYPAPFSRGGGYYSLEEDITTLHIALKKRDERVEELELAHAKTADELARALGQVRALSARVQRQEEEFGGIAETGFMREEARDREMDAIREKARELERELERLREERGREEGAVKGKVEALEKVVADIRDDMDVEQRGVAKWIGLLRKEDESLKAEISELKEGMDEMKSKQVGDIASVRRTQDSLAAELHSLPPPPHVPTSDELLALLQPHIRDWITLQVDSTLATTSPPPQLLSALLPLLEPHLAAVISRNLEGVEGKTTAEAKEYADKKLEEIWEKMRPIVEGMVKFSEYIFAKVEQGEGED